jgi:hypothetical protein
MAGATAVTRTVLSQNVADIIIREWVTIQSREMWVLFSVPVSTNFISKSPNGTLRN